MVILGIRNEINRGSNMGRETFIAPLSWEREPFEWKENKDLWPVVSPISGKVEKENDVIFTNSTQINSYDFRDDFNSKTLGLKWNFRRLPLKNIYSLDKMSFDLLLRKYPKFKMALEKISEEREHASQEDPEKTNT